MCCERLPWLGAKASVTCASPKSATRNQPRREHAVDAARFAELNVRSAARLRPFAATIASTGSWRFCSSQPRRWLGCEPAPDAEARRREFCDRPRAAARRASSQPARGAQRALAAIRRTTGSGTSTSNNNTVYFSPRWRNMLGFDEHDPKISPDWRRLVHPDDMARVQAMIRDHIAGKIPDVRERAPHASLQGRVALGGQPRQGARGRDRPAASGWSVSSSTSPSASSTKTRCSRKRRARRSRCSRSATA